ncbi:putative ankyrin repeat domain-containing protein 30B-like [Plecturocebus cupreus]
MLRCLMPLLNEFLPGAAGVSQGLARPRVLRVWGWVRGPKKGEGEQPGPGKGKREAAARERLSAAAVEGMSDLQRPSPFSQLVYTSNDSYGIRRGDLRKIHEAAWQGQDRKLQKMMKTMDLNIRDVKKRALSREY